MKHYQKNQYIVFQQNTNVSLTELPVLRTLYKPMSMNKSTNGPIVNFMFYKKLWLLNITIFFHIIHFWLISSKKWIYCPKARLISLYRSFFFTLPFFVTYRQETLNFNQGFLQISQTLKYWLFDLIVFLTEFNLKAPSYSKTLHYLQNCRIPAL